jgi:hypothetical protein
MMIDFVGISACVCLLLVAVILRLRNDKSWPREGHGITYFQSTSAHN